MTQTHPAIRELRTFSDHYDYDASYLEQLATDSPGAFEAFRAAQGLSTFRDALPLDAHYVARIAAMRVDDCGACTQLNIRMAVEAGVDRDLLTTLLHEPDWLTEPLRDIHDHARATLRNDGPDEERAARIRAPLRRSGIRRARRRPRGMQDLPDDQARLAARQRVHDPDPRLLIPWP